jgi:signal peptidase
MKFKELWNNEYFKTGLMLVITLIAVFAFWFGSRAALATEYPFLAVASGSMRPTLQVGDLIIVQGISNFSEVHAAPYKANPPGDIIVFHSPKSPEDLIVHRAVNKFEYNNEWYIITKGDANQGIDPWIVTLENGTTVRGAVPEDKIVGKVIGVVPWLGNIALNIQKPLGLFIIAVLLFVLIVMEFILPLIFQKEGKEEAVLNTSIYKGYINN